MHMSICFRVCAHLQHWQKPLEAGSPDSSPHSLEDRRFGGFSVEVSESQGHSGVAPSTADSAIFSPCHLASSEDVCSSLGFLFHTGLHAGIGQSRKRSLGVNCSDRRPEYPELMCDDWGLRLR